MVYALIIIIFLLRSFCHQTIKKPRSISQFLKIFLEKKNLSAEIHIHDLQNFKDSNRLGTMEISSSRALEKRDYLMIFFLFPIETICCGPSSEPSH